MDTINHNYCFQPTCQIPTDILDRIYMETFGFKNDGCFVEFGAHDGWHWSCTWGLAQIGWRGLYAEPEPDLFKACVATNAKRPNVRVANVAVGSTKGQVTLSRGVYGAQMDGAGEPFTVEQVTLDELLEQHQIPAGFDLLVIDVEAGEPEVLAGFTVEKWLPKLVIIERPPKPNILQKAYNEIYSDWINDIYKLRTI